MLGGFKGLVVVLAADEVVGEVGYRRDGEENR